ncbi:hypothetical protein J4476_01625 [Candidatus Woesearchaeota archaeon]|nr:hypothetical protein [Candidatus Woesearchaeota archaeon]
MKTKFFYFFGSFILFLGILWMFIPHAFHYRMFSADYHLFHILGGFFISVIGLLIMILSNKK